MIFVAETEERSLCAFPTEHDTVAKMGSPTPARASVGAILGGSRHPGSSNIHNKYKEEP